MQESGPTLSGADGGARGALALPPQAEINAVKLSNDRNVAVQFMSLVPDAMTAQRLQGSSALFELRLAYSIPPVHPVDLGVRRSRLSFRRYLSFV